MVSEPGTTSSSKGAVAKLEGEKDVMPLTWVKSTSSREVLKLLLSLRNLLSSAIMELVAYLAHFASTLSIPHIFILLLACNFN